MSTIGRAIAAVATCTICGQAKCDCWTECLCGWTKRRGTPACRRCSDVEWNRERPGEFFGTVGDIIARVYRDGIHWTFTLRRLESERAEWRTGTRTATAKAAKAYAMAEAWRALKEREG